MAPRSAAASCARLTRQVLIVDMNAELGKSKAAEFGCTFESADVSKRDSWERILARVEQEYGRLDIICASAPCTI